MVELFFAVSLSMCWKGFNLVRFTHNNAVIHRLNMSPNLRGLHLSSMGK